MSSLGYTAWMKQPEYRLVTYNLVPRTSKLLEGGEMILKSVGNDETALKVYNLGVDYAVVIYAEDDTLAEVAFMSDQRKD